ncbi:MAG: hypothetical protein ACJ8LM_17250 [Candidatus Udaeobacter sp.]
MRSQILRKCRAGIMLENARSYVYDFWPHTLIADDLAEIYDRRSLETSVMTLDRLAGEIRFEIATELGVSYERVWNEAAELDLFDDESTQDLPIGWETSRTRRRRRPIEPERWEMMHVTDFLQSAAENLGLDYDRNKFFDRAEGNVGDRDAARILDYFAWLHVWILDQDTIAAPLVFRVLQSELERLAAGDSAADDPHAGEEL